MPGLYWNTVTDLLSKVLKITMTAAEFKPFRLVGGTSLSLQIGHRLSVDIDLFTDASYDSVDFRAIDKFFRAHFPYVETIGGQVGLGTSYFIGLDEQNAVKVDLYYTDVFVQPAFVIDDIRLATVQEIIAMKMDIISRAGRKKDYWDLHALIDDYSLQAMIELYKQRYPYGHDLNTILRNLLNFEQADNDFDPVCLHGKHWEIIKYDLEQWPDT